MKEKTLKWIQLIGAVIITVIFFLIFSRTQLYALDKLSVEFVKNSIIIISLALIGFSFVAFNLNEKSEFISYRISFLLMGILSMFSLIYGLVYLAYGAIETGRISVLLFSSSLIYLLILLIISIPKEFLRIQVRNIEGKPRKEIKKKKRSSKDNYKKIELIILIITTIALVLNTCFSVAYVSKLNEQINITNKQFTSKIELNEVIINHNFPRENITNLSIINYGNLFIMIHKIEFIFDNSTLNSSNLEQPILKSDRQTILLPNPIKIPEGNNTLKVVIYYSDALNENKPLSSNWALDEFRNYKRQP